MTAFDPATAAHLEKLRTEGLSPRSVDVPPRREQTAPDETLDIDRIAAARRLRNVCLELFEKHGGSPGLAAAELVARAKADPALYDELMRGALEERAMGAMKHVSVQQRRMTERPHHGPSGPSGRNNPPTLSREHLAAWAGEIQAGLLETFQLPDGTYLKDATRDGLLAAASFYREQAVELRAQARWLELIAQSLPHDTPVSARISNDRASELQAIARKDEQEEEFDEE